MDRGLDAVVYFLYMMRSMAIMHRLEMACVGRLLMGLVCDLVGLRVVLPEVRWVPAHCRCWTIVVLLVVLDLPRHFLHWNVLPLYGRGCLGRCLDLATGTETVSATGTPPAAGQPWSSLSPIAQGTDQQTRLSGAKGEVGSARQLVRSGDGTLLVLDIAD